MRLQLTLQHSPNQVLPINYGYLISSWIYHTLGNADKAYAQQLHNKGYDFAGKKYKLFSFSPLRPKRFLVDPKNATFTLSTAPTVLELSFHVDEAVQYFVEGLFKDQKFSLTSGRFKSDFVVGGIEIAPKPIFQKQMRFRTQTPLCISQSFDDRAHATYLSPEVDAYGELLVRNLLRKQAALTPQIAGDSTTKSTLDFPYGFRLLSKPRSKLVSIKGTRIRGFLFDFELMVPEELMEVGYFGGMGEKNSSLGFGMVKFLNY